MDSWLTCRGVSFRYGRNPVIEGFDLSVPPDVRVLVVVGPSGVGKTTLLGLLAGHLRPDRGEIEVCGAPVRGPSARRPLVFQEYGLFPWMTVIDNVGFGLKCAGVARHPRLERARDLMLSLGLRDIDDLYPKELSGGMKQRVGLARALAVSPEVVLLDEPFSALDSETKVSVLAETAQIVAGRRTRFVVVTHDLQDGVFLGDRVVAMQEASRAVEAAILGPAHPRPAGYFHSAELAAERERVRGALSAAAGGEAAAGVL